MRLLEKVEQLFAVLRDVRFRRQQVQHLDVDVHGVRENREELVVLDIVHNFIVDVHQRVQLLRLQQIAQETELLVRAARYFVFVLLKRIQELGQRWKPDNEITVKDVCYSLLELFVGQGRATADGRTGAGRRRVLLSELRRERTSTARCSSTARKRPVHDTFTF